MDISNFVTVLPIVIICYAIGLGLKAWNYVNDAAIPVLLSVLLPSRER